MTTKMRSLRNFRNPIGCLILLAALGAAAGCSTAESPSGSGTNMNHVLPSGSSVAGWLVTPSGGSHASTATLDYIANGGSSGCTECHGSDLSGGISKVSCFSNAAAGCHHVTAPTAPPWGDPAVHGATAKMAPGSSGFASCQICHGSDFSGGGTGWACEDCHGPPAPHPSAPWRGSPYTHTTTNTANAPVCARCHYPNSPNNPANHPATPAPAGTAPGCYNGTMCHNQAGHPSGWVATSPAAQPHGNSAKATPGATAGFVYCQACHGTGENFSGGSSGVSCYPCHGANSPHPSQWNSTDTYKHSTTDTGNAAVCAYCHRNANPGTPDCFNNTLCHGAGGVPHPVGGLWFAFPPAPQAHGNAAKATPGATQGFSYCQVCHGSGTNFDGGSSGVSCYTTCHFVSDTPPQVTPPYPPHPVAPWRASAGSAYTHTNTAPGNASVCAYCHRNSNPGTPDCFNNTLCHGVVGHAVPYNDNSHYAVTSATFPGSCSTCHDVSSPSAKAGPVCQTCHVAASPLTAANCTSCHASPPNSGAPAGAAYANIAGAHGVHIALASAGTPISCDTCHSGLGTKTLNHYNRAKSRVAPGDVLFLATYNAESGASSFDNGAALSCSNVSCHGGQATPNWRTGTLTVNTQCANCHALGTAQFNSYNSGEHQLHVVDRGYTCSVCHNTTTLAVNHFTNLSTTTMEGPASATIGGSGTAITSWNPTTKSCDPTCHGAQTW